MSTVEHTMHIDACPTGRNSREAASHRGSRWTYALEIFTLDVYV